MWFWQRREVYMGKDGPQLYAVRTALEQAGIGFECIVRSGRNYTGADRRMTNAHSADAGIWYVYVRSVDLEAAEGVAQRALRGGLTVKQEIKRAFSTGGTACGKRSFHCRIPACAQMFCPKKSGWKMDGRRKAANACACAGAGRKGAPER